jgi:L-rhamnose mutarotase
MIRRAFTMRLKPGAFEQYKYHHDNIWPELVREIEASGIATITTFRSGDNMVLVSEIENEDAWNRLWTSDIHRKWAEVMEPLMHLTPDGMVDAGELTEIFRCETGAAGGGRRGGAQRRGSRSRAGGGKRAAGTTKGGARRGSGVRGAASGKKSSAGGKSRRKAGRSKR